MNLCAHRYHVQHSIASNHKCCGICQIDLFVNVNSLLDLSASSDIHPTSLSNLVAIIHKPPGQLVQTLINPTSEPKILLLFPFTMARRLFVSLSSFFMKPCFLVFQVLHRLCMNNCMYSFHDYCS